MPKCTGGSLPPAVGSAGAWWRRPAVDGRREGLKQRGFPPAEGSERRWELVDHIFMPGQLPFLAVPFAYGSQAEEPGWFGYVIVAAVAAGIAALGLFFTFY